LVEADVWAFSIAVWVVWPELHKYVYGAVPPPGVAVKVTETVVPFLTLGQSWIVPGVTLRVNGALGWVMVVLAVAVHPLRSVTVTV